MLRNLCGICHSGGSDGGGARIKCVECNDLDICVLCFSEGAETSTHKPGHKYRVVVGVAGEDRLNPTQEFRRKSPFPFMRVAGAPMKNGSCWRQSSCTAWGIGLEWVITWLPRPRKNVSNIIIRFICKALNGPWQ